MEAEMFALALKLAHQDGSFYQPPSDPEVIDLSCARLGKASAKQAIGKLSVVGMHGVEKLNPCDLLRGLRELRHIVQERRIVREKQVQGFPQAFPDCDKDP
jgi:hypothetical protein